MVSLLAISCQFGLWQILLQKSLVRADVRTDVRRLSIEPETVDPLQQRTNGQKERWTRGESCYGRSDRYPNPNWRDRTRGISRCLD